MALGLTEEHLAARGVGPRLGGAQPPHRARSGRRPLDARTAAHGALHRDRCGPRSPPRALLGLHLPEALGGQGYGLPELAIAAGGTRPGAGARRVPADRARQRRPGTAPGPDAAERAGQGHGGRHCSPAAVGFAPGIRAAVAPARRLDRRRRARTGALVVGGDRAGPGRQPGRRVIAGVAGEHGEIWVAVDAADVEITAAGQPRPDPAGWPASARTSSRVPGRTGCSTGLSPRRGRQPGRDPVRRRGLRHRRLGGGQPPPATRRSATSSAGRSASSRRSSTAVPGCSPRPSRRPPRPGTRPRAVRPGAGRGRRVRRRRGRRRSPSTPPSRCATSASRCSAASATPGSTTPTSTTAARCRCGPCSAAPATGPAAGGRRSRSAGAAPFNIEFPAGRPSPVAHSAGGAGRDRGRPRGRRNPGAWPRAAGSLPHLPRPWGRGAGPLEQLVIAEEMRAAGLRAPGLAIGAWVVAGADPVRHAGAAGAVPAGHAARRLPVVPAVQRAGSRAPTWPG